MQAPIYELEFRDNFQKQYLHRYPAKEDRPMTFFDISIDSKLIGRIIFELFSDIVPKTCENFKFLCQNHTKYESYLNTRIHKIIPDNYIQGGDITRGDGRGGRSIYGDYFEDENFIAKHKIEGLLSMANKGPNTNNSQFIITLFPLPWLDGKHVVFGRVIKGYDVVRKIENCGSENGKVKKNVVISNCGVVGNNFGLKFNKNTYFPKEMNGFEVFNKFGTFGPGNNYQYKGLDYNAEGNENFVKSVQGIPKINKFSIGTNYPIDYNNLNKDYRSFNNNSSNNFNSNFYNNSFKGDSTFPVVNNYNESQNMNYENLMANGEFQNDNNNFQNNL
jgi:peptidylprolyl isomerase